MKICEMVAGDMYLRNGELGITPEIARDLAQGKLSPERANEVRCTVRSAAEALFQMPPAGVQFWMAPHRAMA